MPTTMNAGQRIKWARTVAGVGQRELSKLAGLTPAHVYIIELRSESPTKKGHERRNDASTLSKLATALGVTVEWLLSGEGKQPTERTIRAAVAKARVRVESERGAA